MAEWKNRREEYLEKLRDPRWQKQRLEILQRDNWKCRQCQHTDDTLHVHHLYYEKGKEPWEYPNEAFLTLCVHCHESESDQRREFDGYVVEEFKKSGFLSDDLIPICNGLSRAVFTHHPTLIAYAIEFLLQDTGVQTYVIQRMMLERGLTDFCVAQWGTVWSEAARHHRNRPPEDFDVARFTRAMTAESMIEMRSRYYNITLYRIGRKVYLQRDGDPPEPNEETDPHNPPVQTLLDQYRDVLGSILRERDTPPEGSVLILDLDEEAG